ncbi:MAG: hypothetical protein EOO50_04335 [Flavobacterium sp.]|uniref:hypothetical protein n=1 Tax=Flavobacterium sp. TaxID=239 RepID=UPI00120A0457|nr:hypothetical protein [Flavobacterium sp.]RZJ67810.1 MAG: hypothetical protein EOO50_04335 [Flavobacterium sp.]
MKSLSLFISVVALIVSGYFFVVDFRISFEANYLIYMGMLLTLIFICILGILLSSPLVNRSKKRARTLIYNSYMRERTRNKSFDSQLGML